LPNEKISRSEAIGCIEWLNVSLIDFSKFQGVAKSIASLFSNNINILPQIFGKDISLQVSQL
jgi:hypothetical protein